MLLPLRFLEEHEIAKENTVRHAGELVVEYYHEGTNEVYVNKWMNITAFIELNDLPDTKGLRRVIIDQLSSDGYYRTTVRGREVGLYQRGFIDGNANQIRIRSR